ncbi:probable rRNA maturation factor [Thermocrinis minervae]|uniref:Endoribonuclease YbeY n=1 Tax=Thermocrinis minervae TaxID=381751 RepID=A0A1M6QHG6_9AQUI|nr:probable rRNA maturation factor [Thermocrinis minervae]
MKVSIRTEKRVKGLRLKTLKETLIKFLRMLDLEGVEVSVFLCSDETIRELNRIYRNKDKPTDVLSFELNENVGKFTLLGEIVISLDTAKRQAQELKHSLEEELKRLLAHGLVHLLGYDHEKGGEEAKLFFSLEGWLLSGEENKLYHPTR